MRTLFMLVPVLLSGCYRETADYDVRLYGQGTPLHDVLPAPEPHSGVIEVSRVRLWGTNLGLGLAGFSDQPRADGQEFILGSGSFAHPADPSFDRLATVVAAGPAALPNEDACYTVGAPGGYPYASNYVDAGDTLTLVGDGAELRLPRDPATYPRPAGETWFVGYGGTPLPVADEPSTPERPRLAQNWKPGEWQVSFPGTIPPPESAVGAFVQPGGGTLTFPEPVADVVMGGVTLRAPHHGYDDAGVWTGENDDVRVPSPFGTEGLEITWTPSTTAEPVTLVWRYLASGVEGSCDCAVGCGDGFTCEPEEEGSDTGVCVPNEGSTWNVLGELVCTLADDGEFTLTEERLSTLNAFVPHDPEWADGAMLFFGRVSEGTLTVPDAYTFNGKRAPSEPVRTRASDVVATRVVFP